MTASDGFATRLVAFYRGGDTRDKVRHATSVVSHVPEMTTVPSPYNDELGREWLERQWGRATNDEGLSLAIADTQSGEALCACSHAETRRHS